MAFQLTQKRVATPCLIYLLLIKKLPKDTTLNPSVTAEALGKCQTGFNTPTHICVTPQQHNTHTTIITDPPHTWAMGVCTYYVVGDGIPIEVGAG